MSFLYALWIDSDAGTVGPTSEGHWRAQDYDAATGFIPDISGNNRDMSLDAGVHCPFGARNWLYLPGGAGNKARTDDGAAFLPGGDNDYRIAFPLDDYTNGVQTLAAHWNESGVNKRSFRWQVDNTGALVWRWTRDGTVGTAQMAASTVPLTAVAPTDGSILCVRVSHDAGTPGPLATTVTFLYKTVADETLVTSELNSNTGWLPLGAPVVVVADGVKGTPTVTPLTIGAEADDANPAAGRFYGACLRSGNVAAVGGIIYAASTAALEEPGFDFIETQAGRTVHVDRAAAGRKSALVDRPLILFGGTDFATAAPAFGFEFAAGEDLTLMIGLRRYGTPPTAQALTAKRPYLASGALAGHALRVNPDGTITAVLAYGGAYAAADAPAAADGYASLIAAVNAAGTVTAYTAGTAGPPVAAPGGGSTGNTEPLTVGRVGDGEFGDFEFIAAQVARVAFTPDALATQGLVWGVAA